jgi:hypothetical protein
MVISHIPINKNNNLGAVCMKLLTAELRAELPKLYAQEGVENPTVYAKFFFPAGNWTWFVTEGEQDEEDFRFFGYVIGQDEEWGYFSLNELESVNVQGLTVERDLYFTKGLFNDVLAQHKK